MLSHTTALVNNGGFQPIPLTPPRVVDSGSKACPPAPRKKESRRRRLTEDQMRKVQESSRRLQVILKQE
jgi:hypothetical protein